MKTKQDSKHSKRKKFSLSQIKRVLIFILLFLITTVELIDQGAITASISEFKKDLSFNDKDYGLLQSIFIIGTTIGSLFYMVFLNKINRKITLSVALLFIDLSLVSLTNWRKIKLLIFICRGIYGFFWIYIFCLIPIWCEQFSLKDKKILFLSSFDIASNFGSLIGSQLTLYLKWERILYFVQISLLILSIFILCSDEKFFSSNIFKSNKQNQNLRLKQSVMDNSSIVTIATLFEENENLNLENFSLLLKQITNLFKYKFFLIFAFLRNMFFFPEAAFFPFKYEYLQEVLKEKDIKKMVYSFSLISLISPIASFFISLIVEYFILKSKNNTNNSNSNRSTSSTTYSLYVVNKRLSIILLLFYSAVSTFGILQIMVDYKQFFFFHFLFEIFSSVAMTYGTTYVMSILPNELKATGTSFNCLIGNAFGRLSAPYLYGVLKGKFGLNLTKQKELLQKIFGLNAVFTFLFFISIILRFRMNDFPMEKKESTSIEDESYMEKLNKTEDSIKRNSEEKYEKLVYKEMEDK